MIAIFYRLWYALSDKTGEEFDLEYRPETVKEGFISDKVTGNVHMTIQSKVPPFFKEEIIARDEKSTGEIKGLIKKRLSYQNPKGMDEVLDYVYDAIKEVKNKELEEYLHQKYHGSDGE